MSESSERRPNRLIHESSPYLRQHAFNPVDWYPWGEEALQLARESNRPIFLSIGYSACHWCHVMEHESFENADIAAFMNANFVNIKVDREERPDLDRIYMNSVLAITGRGGWPMSVFLAPDMRPFYGGTYWPPFSRMGMPGFRDVLQKVASAWQTDREKLLAGAEELTEAVQQMSQPRTGEGQPDESLLKVAMETLVDATDWVHGGFGAAPKFPHPMDLRVLLRCAKRFDHQDAGEAVQITLDKMATGGIYDQLAGGFHRYSTDAHWLVPHFEKMLYDNALLVPAYLESAQSTGNVRHAQVARETLDYILEEMTQPEGGFFSTQDADSEGEEGKFFVWSMEQVIDCLGEDHARLFNACYDVTPDGNWEGKTILRRVMSNDDLALEFEKSAEEVETILADCREQLLKIRSQRIAPDRDEKIIVAWNGMTIAAMSQGARYFHDERYAQAARNAADFLLANCCDPSGRLLHVYKDGVARLNAYLDDYACLIDGLVELFQTVFDARYLEEASQLASRMIERFSDSKDGGFFYTSDDHEALISRMKDSSDDATPSGNAMAATALLKLARLTGNTEWEDMAFKTLQMLSRQLKKYPMAGGQSLIAVDFLLGPSRELVVVEGSDSGDNLAVWNAIHQTFLPHCVVHKRTAEMNEDDLPAILKTILQQKTSIDGQVTLYACERGSCEEPIIGVDAIRKFLQSMSSSSHQS
ncbi:MAG: thioredoxin domain-containing protein [Planctomycetaceae bacterium]